MSFHFIPFHENEEEEERKKERNCDLNSFILFFFRVQIGARYDQTVLPSIVTEVLKAAVAQFDAGELITLRETVSTNIRAALVDRADQFGIKVAQEKRGGGGEEENRKKNRYVVHGVKECMTRRQRDGRGFHEK